MAETNATAIRRKKKSKFTFSRYCALTLSTADVVSLYYTYISRACSSRLLTQLLHTYEKWHTKRDLCVRVCIISTIIRSAHNTYITFYVCVRNVWRVTHVVLFVCRRLLHAAVKYAVRNVNNDVDDRFVQCSTLCTAYDRGAVMAATSIRDSPI